MHTTVLPFKGLGMRNLQYEIMICQKNHNKVTKIVNVQGAQTQYDIL